MKFKIGDVVSLIHKSGRVGMVAENSQYTNSNGTRSVRLLLDNKKSRWINEDLLQTFSDDLLKHIPIPDGVFSVIGDGQCPVVYVKPESTASQSALEEFAAAIQRMWVSKQAA